MWCNADTQWLDMSYFDKCITDMKPDDFQGDYCIYGVDLASKIDIACVVKLFWRIVDDEVHYYVFCDYWLPRDSVTCRTNTSYSSWIKNNKIHMTEGAIIDINEMQDFIENDASKYITLCVGYDPFQATQMACNLSTKGLEMVEVGATVKNMSEPMKYIQALIYAGRIHFSKNDPIIRYMFNNVVCHTDVKENIYPRKEKTDNKIDGAVATIMAMRMAIFKDVENTYLDAATMITSLSI